VETGLELHAFLVAAISMGFGFHHEIGRVLSSLWYLASAALVWTFVRRRYGDEAGLIATFIYAFGFPLALFIERAFMNEALLISLSLAALVAAQRSVDGARPAPVAVLVTATSLIAMIKLPYLIVWAPVAGLFMERYGRATFKRPELWLMMSASAAAAAGWYWHAHSLGATTGLSVGLTDKLFDPAIVFSFEYPRRLADRFLGDIFGPVGVVASLAGLYAAWRERRWFEVLGVAAFAAYLVIVAGGNFVHNYYQLAIVPVAPPLIALGLLRISERLCATSARRARLIAGALAIAAASTFIRSVSANSWYEYSHHDVEACRQIASVTDPSERVAFLAESNPKWLFCTDRKGWLVAPADTTAEAVGTVRLSGASVLIVPRAMVDQDVRLAVDDAGRVIATTALFDVVRVR
jgi:4-amino-4-deoxy-L-arabinose transferase-like glycosyltransferase